MVYAVVLSDPEDHQALNVASTGIHPDKKKVCREKELKLLMEKAERPIDKSDLAVRTCDRARHQLIGYAVSETDWRTLAKFLLVEPEFLNKGVIRHFLESCPDPQAAVLIRKGEMLSWEELLEIAFPKVKLLPNEHRRRDWARHQLFELAQDDLDRWTSLHDKLKAFSFEVGQSVVEHFCELCPNKAFIADVESWSGKKQDTWHPPRFLAT